MGKKRILAVFGTRPEVIKLWPVVRELKKRSTLVVRTCCTAQHREMMDQMLRLFRMKPDYDLDLMRKNQTLTGLAASIIRAIKPVYDDYRPHWVVVQGDTTTAAIAGLSAYYDGIRVAHVEAGLRTGDKHAPFPEELNRRLTAVVADLHFAPTLEAKKALLKEGVAPGTIHVTGNTVIDTLKYVQKSPLRNRAIPGYLRRFVKKRKLVVVTCHRRENIGNALVQVCRAIRELVRKFDDLWIVFPVHRNPNVGRTVKAVLGTTGRVLLTTPLDYDAFIYLLSKAVLIMTDSGGIQEEAPTLGVPVYVLRDKTERREGLLYSSSRLIGTDSRMIVRTISEYLAANPSRKDSGGRNNPFGDGKAARRIAGIIAREAGRE